MVDFDEIPERPDAPPSRVASTHVVYAAFPGTCHACGGEIEEGDEIVRDDEDESWIHEGCS